MTRAFNLSDAAPLPDDATLVDGGFVDPYEHNAARRRERNLYNKQLLSLQDKETMYAGAGAPIAKPQGKLYYDTTEAKWRGYKTTAGTTQHMLADSTTAYALDLSTAGTGTVNAGGVLNVNTTQVEISTEGSMIQYSAPANSLADNGVILQACAFGTKTGTATNAEAKIIFFNASAIDSQLPSTMTDWFSKAIIVRTSATTAKAFFVRKINLDNGTVAVGTAQYVESVSEAIDASIATTVRSYGDPGSGDTMTCEMMLTRLIP